MTKFHKKANVALKKRRSPKFKCHQIADVIKTQLLLWNQKVNKTQISLKRTSPKIKCYQNAIITNTQISSECKYHHNANVPNTQMSPKCKCHLNANVTQTQISQKLKFHQNPNVTKTQMSPKCKCHQNTNVQNTNATKTQILQKLKSSKGVWHNQVSGSVCHVTHVKFFFMVYFTKWWSYLVEGLVSTGPPRLVSLSLVALIVAKGNGLNGLMDNGGRG